MATLILCTTTDTIEAILAVRKFAVEGSYFSRIIITYNHLRSEELRTVENRINDIYSQKKHALPEIIEVRLQLSGDTLAASTIAGFLNDETRVYFDTHVLEPLWKHAHEVYLRLRQVPCFTFDTRDVELWERAPEEYQKDDDQLPDLISRPSTKRKSAEEEEEEEKDDLAVLKGALLYHSILLSRPNRARDGSVGSVATTTTADGTDRVPTDLRSRYFRGRGLEKREDDPRKRRQRKSISLYKKYLSEREQEYNEGKDILITQDLGLIETIADCMNAAMDGAFPILIEGETGTGKELFAKLCAKSYLRTPDPLDKYVATNAALFLGPLFLSELFGHEKGSFTGADHEKKGLVDQVENGVLFIDEINSVDLTAQSQLLRFIQHGEYRRVGGTEVLKSNAKLIFATNQNPETLVENGVLRADFYYRISMSHFTITPLRERPNDIPYIIRSLCRNKPPVAQHILDTLKSAPLHGNVRELQKQLSRYYAGRPLTTTSNSPHPAAKPVDVESTTSDGLAHATRVFADALLAEGNFEKKRNFLNVAEQHLLRYLVDKFGSGSQAAKATMIPVSTINDKRKKYKGT